jgi:hypothetical protein
MPSAGMYSTVVDQKPKRSLAAGAGRETARNDMPKYLGDVRCWVNSGKHMLALSFSEFDLQATSAGTSMLQ